MSGSIVLTLIAAVLSVGEGTVTIGGEGVEWLARGDRGSVYYELKVGPEARRIEVGSAEVVSVDGDQAVMAMSAGLERVQAGYSVELTVPYERARTATGAAPRRVGGVEPGRGAQDSGAAAAGADLEASNAELRRRIEALQQTANEAAAERYELTRKLRAAETEKEELILQMAASGARRQETGAEIEQTRAELAAARQRVAALDETTARLEGRNAELEREIEALVFVLGKTVAESAK